ncbi:T9SS type A sorting domain-containing protein [Bacteroidales bacterium OttesenSCG-928-I14]|nr:T9SS type A sorting domain-containing protein [Bacteroidales bacterium OttesenSCG-928-I14]
MRKILLLATLVVLGYSACYAGGPWVIGVNQLIDFYNKIEQGTGETPPNGNDWIKTPNADGSISFKTDLGDWDKVEGVTVMANTDENKGLVAAVYPKGGTPELTTHLGILSVDYAGKGYKQVDGTVIKFHQVMDINEYPGEYEDLIGEGKDYKNAGDFIDRHEIRWLHTMDLSGNDLRDVSIDGYYTWMLKKLSFKDNAKLSSLKVVNCEYLEELDVRGTALSEADFEELKDTVLEASPDCVILGEPGQAISDINPSAFKVYFLNDKLCVENKAAGDVVSVYDLSGRTVAQSANEINISGKGVYLVKVNNNITKVVK